jgi:uncharacterized glyoxalase superfamily protein PhnB
MTDTQPAVNVFAVLLYADAPAAIQFLTGVFGFEEALVVTGADGREVAHAELRWPEGGGVMLSSYDEKAEITFGRPGGASVYVVTDAPDPIFERASAAGARLVREMREEDYGSRGFSVADAEGNVWSFGTYRGV